MKIKFSKKTILYFLLFLWIVFSVSYIAWTFWSNFKNIQMFNAYEQGRVDTINALIQEAEKCEPISVFGEEKKIELINTDCLAPATEE